MKELSRYKVLPLIRETKGRLFSCKYKKKDKSLRYILCQIPKPKENPKRAAPAKENNSYILVTDVVLYRQAYKRTGCKAMAKDESYRLINLATLQQLTISGITYTITG